MRSRTPAVATWLLERFGTYNQPLIGDLIEEYRAGRSALWYWSQVVAAIFIASFKHLRAHKLLALRALAIGYASIWLGASVLMEVNRWMLRPWLLRGVFTHGNGFLIGELLWTLPLSAVYVGSGWIVARTHRPYSMAMVLPLMTVLTFLMLPRVCRLVLDAFTNERYLPYLAIAVLNVLVMIFGVFSGGLLGSGRLQSTDMNSDSVQSDATPQG